MCNKSGIIGWMVCNRVTPNLLMIILLAGGIFMSSTIKQEVFPEFELDRISISVAYPGASPEEIEQSIVFAIEQSIQGVEGIKETSATASEGQASVRVELMDDASDQKVLQDIEQEVARINTFPIDAEDPNISLVSRKRQVIRLNLYGNVSERALHEVVEQVKDQLLLSPGITQVEISGARNYELIVEIPMEKLRMYGLAIEDVSNIIRTGSVDVPGGKLETEGGDILLRVINRSDWASEFSRIPIVTHSDGTIIYLEDVAVVKEGFEETNRVTTYDKQQSMQLRIFRVGKQTPIGVSKAAYLAMEQIEGRLPPAISWKFASDSSKIYKQRLELLLKNALLGLALVLLLLGFFLELKLAFWVTMGIPISFLGGLLFLPFFDVSINMISMFAFIIALGIVVDDAIIAGENIYEYRQRGLSFVDAAIQGGKDVAIPITFSILTNIVAFLPLYFVPGVMGKVWRVIPLVVIVVFAISWFESLFILPAHLAHSKKRAGNPVSRALSRFQQSTGNRFNAFVANIYGPFLDRILQYKLLTISLLILALMVTAGWVFSGRIGMILMPRVESDRAVVTATLPYGSPLSDVFVVRDKLVDGMERVAGKNGEDLLLEGISAHVSDNVVEVNGYLTPSGIRPLSTREVTKKWRQEVGPVVGLQSLRYESDRGGPGGGAGLSVELSHKDIEILDKASQLLADKLEQFSSIKDVDTGYTPGKVQIDFRVNERGQSLGLTASEVGRQVRNAFQGAIALRQMRNNNEVTVRVRLPENQRHSEYDIESLLLSTSSGVFVPLTDVATVTKGRAFTSINRRDSRRTVMVSANVDPIGDSSVIIEALKADILPEIGRQFNGLSYGFEGRQADRKESVGSLLTNFIFALGAIYFLLAIPFRSYIQPLTVMVAIPFGIVGAVIGHLIMGYNLSLMSMMGVVALSGIVVNDALVLIDYANKQQTKGMTPYEAIKAAGIRRFRPVILTTFTTFGGLAPMIFETSRQARFMIPMAISLGFGILFATIITLILVPCLYLLIEDTKRFLFQDHKKLS